jgi:transposase-like protein
MFWLKGKIEKNNNLYKRAKKKIRNLNNEDQIEKYNIINLNWRMILKTNKIFTKRSRKKIRNQKNNDQIEKI